jgi:hypothetical protein
VSVHYGTHDKDSHVTLNQPALLDVTEAPRRRIDVAFYVAVMESYVHGMSDPQGRRPGRRFERKRGDLQV